MKKTQEFEGKNVDRAIEKACSALSLTKKNLKYDIISSGSSGIFGIVGMKKARIRVTLPEKNGGFEKNNKKSDPGDLNGVMSIVDEAFGQKKDPVKSKENRSGNKKPQTGKTDKKNLSPEKSSSGGNGPDKSKADGSQADTVDTFDQDKKREAQKIETDRTEAVQYPSVHDAVVQDTLVHDAAVQDTAPVQEDQGSEEDRPSAASFDKDEGFPPSYRDEEPVDVPEEAVNLGMEALQKMIDLITQDASVSAETHEDKLLLKVSGGNSGVLIGRRGQTLEAMQFLTDKIINRKSESRVRLKVDIEGYMETRTANLKALAFKMADKAKKTGRPATINQMTAQDRRIVHLALKDDFRVRTQSMGDGYYRRLVIFPRQGASKKKNQSRKQFK
ncbi:MAG: RNA-binding cell elongation regulator Jag/EloR [Thermodesulfobacteriota bacterium]|nr:RNA-binding cell elongation regulator Jag/EloR [Thermodesulfobacteriota bacterium]